MRATMRSVSPWAAATEVASCRLWLRFRPTMPSVVWCSCAAQRAPMWVRAVITISTGAWRNAATNASIASSDDGSIQCRSSASISTGRRPAASSITWTKASIVSSLALAGLAWIGS